LVLVAAIGLTGTAVAKGKKRSKKAWKKGKKAKGAVKPKAKPQPLAIALKFLSSADTAKAAKAAWSLGLHKNKQAVDALLDGLALGLHPKVARAALLALAEQGQPRSLSVVRYYLTYRDPKVRAAAVTAVGAIEDARATKLVMAAMRDGDKSVRAAALDVVAKRKMNTAIGAVLELMKKGDEATARAAGSFANTNMARAVGELIGVAPNALVARALGLILVNPKFGPESARIQVVKALAKVPGNTAVEQLSAYIESVPAKPPRQSRRMAEAVIEQRLTGGK
jgi:HEAT repeat protein